MRIVVATDGSVQALDGARWTARLRLSDADEVIVVAVAHRPVILGAWTSAPALSADGLEDAAWSGIQLATQDALAAAVEALGTLPCAVRSMIREGHPGEALPRLCRETEADLIVVGPHGRGRLQELLMGSVSQSLLHSLPCAVLVARPSPVEHPPRALLATDGSAPSMAAARFLLRLPLPEGTSVAVTTVATEPVGPTIDQERAAAAALLEETAALFEQGGFPVDTIARSGDAKQRILEVVRETDPDLLVVGARGLGGFTGLVLGSVSRALSKAARCSVLVVPEHRLTAM